MNSVDNPPPLALVTGTSSGIGAALAAALLGRGWTVIGLARRAADFDHPDYRHIALDLADNPILDLVFGILVDQGHCRAEHDLIALKLGHVDDIRS